MHFVTALLDADGFLRRECPHCEREFKWRETDGAGEAVSRALFHCPYCGKAAGADEWWTRAQLQLIEPELARIADAELANVFSVSGRADLMGDFRLAISPSQLPGDPNDMLRATPLCHPNQPMKIAEAWSGPLHCIECGSPFLR